MKALELANTLDSIETMSDWKRDAISNAAAELRRLAEVNAELLGALEKARASFEARCAAGDADMCIDAIAKAKEQQ